MPKADLDAEVIAEEDVGPAEQPVRPLPLPYQPAPPPSRACPANVAVRAVSSSAARKRPQRRLIGRSERPVVASRSFLIDVHLLGR